MKIKLIYKKIVNKLSKNSKLNSSLFNKIFFTWTSKKLTLSSKNLKFFLERIYPAYLIAEKIPGCFVECGVGYGRSALIIESILQFKKDFRNLFLFDSFQGFPELSKEDMTGNYQAKKGEWNYINENNLKEIISCSNNSKNKKEYFADNKSRIHIHKGFFADTLNEEVLLNIKNKGGISFLHIDVDLYESYKQCLEKLLPLVNPGGIILFDEYNDETLKKFPGSKKAIDEYLLSQNIDPNKILEKDISGKFYMIKA